MSSCKRLSEIGLVVWFTLAISLPVILFAAGVEPSRVDNREFTPVPEMSVSNLRDASYFGALDDAYRERLPLRDRMIELDARLSLDIFKESPTDRVVLGLDGYLFSSESLSQRCPQMGNVSAAERELTLSAQMLAAAGKSVFFVIAPDKASIYPEQLSEPAPCVEASSVFWSEVRSPNLITGWDVLTAAKPQGSLYYKLDTHWTLQGASVMAMEIIGNIDGDVAATGSIMEAGPYRDSGDLTRLMGVETVEETAAYQVVRAPPVTVSDAANRQALDDSGNVVSGVLIRTHQSAGGPMVGGTTVVLHDSFGNALRMRLAPFFAESTWLTRSTDPSQLPAREWLGDADTIILETVQRHAYSNWVRSKLSEKFAAALADDLPGGAVRELAEGDVYEAGIPEGPAATFLIVERTSSSKVTVELDSRPPRQLTSRLPRVAYEVVPGSTVRIHVSVGTARIWTISIDPSSQ